MSRILKYFCAVLILFTFVDGVCTAQQRSKNKRATKSEKISVEEHRSQVMQFIIEGEDTVYLGQTLPAARVFERLSKQRGKDWRQYYRLVYNFSKVYPYAVAAKSLLAAVDSTITTDELRRGKKERYIAEMQTKLFDAFETPFRAMTITQGALMMRLIDRETGIAPYSIIKDYKNTMAAGFWQGVAKMFSMNLKDPYDPEGIDRETEELVQLWQHGEFESLYFALFGVIPEIPEIKPDFYK